MADERWIEYDGVELINVARTARLAQSLGIDTVRIRNGRVEWIESQFTGLGFGLGQFGLGPFGGGDDVVINAEFADITNAPWYDAGVEASAEFAGFIPLNIQGLDDSTLSSTPIEYITDGGHSGKARNATLPVVFNLVAVASTERGVEYAKRWLNRRLRGISRGVFCSGADLRYFRSGGIGATDYYPETAHRRDVRLTRGTSVTRKRSSRCSAMWWMTFTMTAADPFEYGDPILMFDGLGRTTPLDEAAVLAQGTLTTAQIDCPAYDYSPIFDPDYPALVASPTAPNFLPENWTIEAGDTFRRYWVLLDAAEPSDLFMVPMLVVRSSTAARMLRISVWESDVDKDSQCGALFSAVITYLPAGQDLYIDSEQRAAYVWDGYSPTVRRCDSLIFSPDANPLRWEGFDNPSGLLVTLDTFALGGGYEGGGNVRVEMSLVPKSD